MVKQGDSELNTAGANSAAPKRRLVKSLSRKAKLATVLMLVLLVGAGVAVWYWYDHREPVTPTVRIMTEAQAEQANLDKLQQQAPSASATTAAKADYYEQLEHAKAENGDYQGAIEAFKQREALAKDTLAYYDYLLLTDYYRKVDDKTDALKALDSAEALLPAQSDPDNGYFRSEELRGINEYREALQK